DPAHADWPGTVRGPRLSLARMARTGPKAASGGLRTGVAPGPVLRQATARGDAPDLAGARVLRRRGARRLPGPSGCAIEGRRKRRRPRAAFQKSTAYWRLAWRASPRGPKRWSRLKPSCA